jgi:hypothetical protein
MSSSSNGISPCKNKVEGEIRGFETDWVSVLLSIKKKKRQTDRGMDPANPSEVETNGPNTCSVQEQINRALILC